MTYNELKVLLTDSQLFADYQIDLILRMIGKYTIGNAIVACEVIGIQLTGDDVDVLININK